MSLKEALRRLEASLGTSPQQAISRFVLEDEGTVSMSVSRPGGGTSRVSVCYVDVAAYPHCGIWLNAESEASNDDPELEQLHKLGEQFQEHSPLERVVEELLKLLGIQLQMNGPDAMLACDAPVLRAGSLDAIMEHAQEAAQSEADNGDSDGMEQDEDSDAPVDVDDEGDEGGGGGGGDDDDDDDAEDDDDEEEREMMISCGLRQGRWERWEERCREAEASNSGKAGLSHEQASALKQQIFEPREAFMMLSKELLHILRRQSYDMFVDTVGDNVFAWSVELAAFDTGSNLFKDMQEIQRRHQYSFVKLVIRFKRGLHPFYPPSVEVVRPHLRGSVAAAVAAHPMLKLGNWDPWRPVEELIRQIKMFLQAAARVDLDHPMNDITRFPLSSYRPLEVHLARLTALSGCELSCQSEPEVQELFSNYSHDQARLEALASDSSKKRSREATPLDMKTVWARGTGYGSGNRSSQDPVWDARASEAAQRARDEELRMLLESLAADLAFDLGSKVDTMNLDEPAAGTAPCSSSQAAAPQPHPDPSSSQCEEAEQQLLAPDPIVCLQALSASCLMPFLVQELKSASFTDMCTRTPFYLAVLGLCKVLAQHEGASRQLWQQVEDRSSVASLVLAMAPSAKQYARVTKPLHDKEIEEQAAAAAALEATQAALGLAPKPPAPALEPLQEMQGGLQLAGLLQDISSLLREQPMEASEAGPSGERGGAASNSNSLYCETLRPVQVEYIPDLRSMSHLHASHISTEGVQPKARMSRLAKEMAGLQQLLPLNECSSVFVRIDEENVSLWRALITGPEDTPYSAGCFLFDFYFPPNYPAVPPQVLLRTTGGGRVRFNPNLYHTGKVCLSLLGTWEGAKGEGWNPTASSALQVLLSIQSLILVPQPYFNEPGYERKCNSDEGKDKSREYNTDITEGTLRYAMIDLLQHTPKEFEAAIKGHFRLRRQVILDTVQGWIQAAATWNPSHASRLTALRDQLAPLLSHL